MLQQATATLSSIFTNKFVVKAIKPTLKLAKVEITSAMTYALNYFDPSTNTVITLSNPAVSDQEGATLVVTSPDELTSYNVSTVKFKTGDTQIGAYVSFPQWVGYTIAGNGIAVGTTITAWYRRKPVDCNPIYLRSGTPGVFPTEQINPGFVLSLIEKTQLKIDMASLGIPWIENEAYTFEFSEDFTVGTEPDKNFSSPATNIAYTANPPLAITSTVPPDNDTGTEVNDYVILNFNRTVTPYIGQNFYFYETNGATSTLLKTIPVTNNIISRNKITLDVRGLMKESTSYYVLSDEEILKDSDNFVFNGITSNQTFNFTSAVPVDFRGFISIQVSFGTTLATVFKRASMPATSISSLFTAAPIVRKTARTSASLASLFTYTRSIVGNRKRYTASMSAISTMPLALVVRIRSATANLASTITSTINAQSFREASAYLNSAFTATADVLKLKQVVVSSSSEFTMAVDSIKFRRATAAIVSQFTSSAELTNITKNAIAAISSVFTINANPAGTTGLLRPYTIIKSANDGSPYNRFRINQNNTTELEFAWQADDFPYISHYDNPDYMTLEFNQSSNTGETIRISTIAVPYNRPSVSGYHHVVLARDPTTSVETVRAIAKVYGMFQSTATGTAIANPNVNTTNFVDLFGYTLALGDKELNYSYLVVGASSEDSSTTTDAGVVYLYLLRKYNLDPGDAFERADATLLYTWTNPTSGTSRFGWAVDTDGTNTIIGSQDGGVKIYSNSTGNLVSTAALPATLSDNNNSVAIKGNYAIVNSSGNEKAFVIEVSTGNLIYTITNPDTSVYSTQFASSVAISNNYFVIGNPTYTRPGATVSSYPDATGYQVGRTYVYSLATGNLVRTIDRASAVSLTNPTLNAYYNGPYNAVNNPASYVMCNGFGGEVGISEVVGKGVYVIVGHKQQGNQSNLFAVHGMYIHKIV